MSDFHVLWEGEHKPGMVRLVAAVPVYNWRPDPEDNAFWVECENDSGTAWKVDDRVPAWAAREWALALIRLRQLQATGEGE